MLGVIKAVDAYNPYENSHFSSYAAAAIRQNVDRYICNFERIIRIPVHMMEKINTANDLIAKAIAMCVPYNGDFWDLILLQLF